MREPRPKVTPRKIENIEGPIDDIEQGDAYGNAFIKQDLQIDAREEEIAQNQKLCNDLHELEVERYNRKEEARKKLEEAVQQALKKKNWLGF